MISRTSLLTVIFCVSLTANASAQMRLGVSLAQGNNRHPIITRIDDPNGTAASLGLQPDDEIRKMHSDSIIGADGKGHSRWNIGSVNDVLWVLKRTRSTIGITYKRNGEFYEVINVYEVHCDHEQGRQRGYRPKGSWIHKGPYKVESPD